jgi:hypothetical protein
LSPLGIQAALLKLPFAVVFGQIICDLVPFAEHLSQAKRWFDGALDLMDSKAEFPPFATLAR